MKKLPILTAAAAFAVVGVAADAQAQWSDNCRVECRSDPDGGQMCWSTSGGSDYSSCWEDVLYDDEGNEIWKYCNGWFCSYAE